MSSRATPLLRYDDYGVLIVAYKRSEGLKKILEICKENSIKRIYVAIDAAKDNETKLEQGRIDLMLSEFSSKFDGELRKFQRRVNVGCAASVLSAVDWLFENEKYGIVLEDDCIPTSDFFSFSEFSLPIIEADSEVWLSCGTQLAPKDLSNSGDPWLFSSYALTWGWATTSTKWNEIRLAFAETQLQSGRKNSIDKVYWSAGAKRALKGYTDIWDTVLVTSMLAQHKMAILPNVPLVTNIGNDEHATHTLGSSPWLHAETGTFVNPISQPKVSTLVDAWIRDFAYRIRLRHLLSTKLTLIKDLLGSHKNLGPLLYRWQKANDERKVITT